MLWDIYIRSAWQALASEERAQAAHLFRLAQAELSEDEADALAPESDLGLAFCALASQQDAELVHHLQNCQARVHRCPPQQAQLCADKLAELAEALRPRNDSVHQLSLEVLQLLPETPQRYREAEWWAERQQLLAESPDQEACLEELAVGLRFGWTLPLEQLETSIRALARLRRQRSEGAPLARLAELIREHCRSLAPAQAARTLSRFCQIFLSDGLPALADQLWFQILRQGALGAARSSKFLRRRLEKTNLAGTTQVLLQGLSLLAPDRRQQAAQDWSRFWLAHPSPRLDPLVATLAGELPVQLRVALAERAARQQAWEVAGQALSGLDLASLESDRERLTVVEQALSVASHHPGLETLPWLEQKVQLLEKLGESGRLPDVRLTLARQTLIEQPAQAEGLLRETLRELGESQQSVGWAALECWLLMVRSAQQQGQTVAARVRAQRAGELAAELQSRVSERPGLLGEVKELVGELGVGPPPVSAASEELFESAPEGPLEELPELIGPAATEEEFFEPAVAIIESEAAVEPEPAAVDPAWEVQLERLRQLHCTRQFEGAEALSRTLLELPDGLLRGCALVNWGMICLQQGQPAQAHLEAAASLLNEGLQLPEAASLALGRSLLSLQAGERYEALLHFQPAAIYTGEFPEFERGLYHYLGGQLESQAEAGVKDLLEAESIWTQLGQPAPLLGDVRWRLAELLQEQSDLSELEPVLLRVRGERLNDEQLQTVHQVLVRAAEQAQAPERVLEYSRTGALDAASLQRAARACEQLEHYAEAAAYCKRWAAQVSDVRPALEKAAYYLEWAGQAEEAFELYDRLLLGEAGGDPKARLSAASELRRQGRWELSQFVLSKAEGGDREAIGRLWAENALSLEQPARALDGPLALQFRAAVQLGDGSRAGACLEKLRGSEEMSPGQLQLAELLLLGLNQEWKAATELADRLAGEWLDDPLLPQLWRARAWLRRAQHDYAGARADTALAWEVEPADGDLWNLAQDCARSSDLGAAEGHLRRLLEQLNQGLGPFHSLTQRARLLLGQVVHSLDRLAEARELLSQCDRGSDAAVRLQACAEMAFIEVKTSQWSEAESHFSKAYELLPAIGSGGLALPGLRPQQCGRPPLLWGWSRALASLGRFSEGQEIYRQALSSEEAGAIKLDFADYLLWHQQPEAAFPLLDSSEPRALLGRMRILLEKGARDQAEEVYDQIGPEASDLLAVAVGGAELAAAFGFTAQAAEQFQRALERLADAHSTQDPYERVRAQFGQGRAHMVLGQFQQATACLQRASFLVAKEPCWMKAEVLLALGQAQRRVGQRTSAESNLQAALETALPIASKRSPRLLKFYQALGENWLEQGQEDQAREVLQKGLELDVDRNGTEARPFLTLLARIDKLQLPGPPRMSSLAPPAPRVVPRPMRAPAPPPAPAAPPPKKKFKRPSQRELVVFGRQFHSLLQAGVPILRALVSCQQPGSRLAPVLEEVENRVRGGNPMSSSIAEYPNVFGLELSCMFLVAEQSGRLLGVLQRWADDLETREQRRLQLQSAIFYPLLVLSTCIAAIATLMIVFVPLIRDTLTSNNVEPPLPTVILLTLSDWLRNPKIWLAAVVALLAGWQIAKKIDPSMESWKQRGQALLLGMPVMGRLYQLSLFSGYFHSFATLVESGVRLDLAIEMAGSAISHRGIQGQLKECRKNLLDGDDVGQAFEKIASAPGFAFQFVAIGMEAGKLPQMCRVVSHTLDMDFELASHALKAVIEPTIMLVAGLATAFVVWAAISPTLSLINSL